MDHCCWLETFPPNFVKRQKEKYSVFKNFILIRCKTSKFPLKPTEVKKKENRNNKSRIKTKETHAALGFFVWRDIREHFKKVKPFKKCVIHYLIIVCPPHPFSSILYRKILRKKLYSIFLVLFWYLYYDLQDTQLDWTEMFHEQLHSSQPTDQVNLKL